MFSARQRVKAPEVAIIGAGLMGAWHLFTARKLGAQIVAVVDPDLAAARALAGRVAGAKALGDMASLMKHHRPFAAHICTPTRHHFDNARELLAAGTHVLVEKPICESVKEARALAMLARDQNVLVCPVHQYAFQPGVERAMGWLAELGAVRRIHFAICSSGADHLPADRRGAIIAEILPHPISILQRLVPERLTHQLEWCISSDSAGEYFAHASQGGLMLSISISLNARPTCFLTCIEADGGAVEIDGFHGFATLAHGGSSRVTKVLAPFERSSKTLTAATLNLARRLVQREPAYPGLRTLMRRFYSAASSGDLRACPVSMDHVVQGSEIWSDLCEGLPLLSAEPV